MAGKKKKKKKLKYFSKRTIFHKIQDDFIGCSEGVFCITQTPLKQEMLAEARYLQSLKDKKK